MRKGLVVAAVLALTAGAMAQPADPRVSPLDRQGWVLGDWPDLLKSLQPDAPPLARYQGTGLGQTRAMAGREDLVLYDPPGRTMRTVCQPLLRDGKPVDPVAYIAEAARAAPITMINESHAEPVTRDFIAKVAAALRPLGYDGYAAETFNPEIGERGPAMPLMADGGYSDEPIYGRLIRRLRALDYRLLSYEPATWDRTLSPRDMAVAREIGQAANLVAQMKRVTGKMLVHVGHDHLLEYAAPGQVKPMATVFTQTTGIDPLTITTTRFEAPGETPVVCDPAAFAGLPHTVDIRIGLPALTFERGRPLWRHQAGDRYVDIPAALRRADQVAVYEARPAGERGDSTPMERLLLRPGETLPLLLPPGRYDLSVWTEKDGWSATMPLAVAN